MRGAALTLWSGFGSVKVSGLHPTQVGDGRLPRGDGPQGLGLAKETQEPAELGPRLQPERFHRFAAVEERRRGDRSGLLGVTGHQLAHDASAGSLPYAHRRIAAQRPRVGQREEQEIERLVAEVAEKAIAGPARHRAGHGQVHGAEMLAHQALQHGSEPAREPPSGRDLTDPLGATDVVTKKSRSTILHGAGLGLGDVVEERGQLEGLPTSDAWAERLVEVCRENVAPWLELSNTEAEDICAFHGAQAVLPDIEAMRVGLSRLLHRMQLGQHDGQGAPVIEKTEPLGGGGLAENAQQLVSRALRGDSREAGRRALGRSLDPAVERPSRPDGQTRGAK